MSTPSADTYDIRVAGHLDDSWAAWLGGLTLTRDDDGTTTLTCRVTDQAQLHGILNGIRDIGARLIAVHPHTDRRAGLVSADVLRRRESIATA